MSSDTNSQHPTATPHNTEILAGVNLGPYDKWVLVTAAWRVLRLRMEEQPPIWRVAANILNTQSRTADKGWSSSLGVGQGADNSSLLNCILLRNIHRQSHGPGLILWYDLNNERGTWVILPIVLYGCETWSLTMREEHRLRVFANRVLRILGPKRDEVTGEWRKLHNEELNDLYCLPNILRVIK